MSKDMLSRIRTIHGNLHETRVELARELHIRRVLKTSTPNTVFLVGTPLHSNVGDSAIVLAEIAFLKRILPAELTLVEIMEYDFSKQRDVAVRGILRTTGKPVFWHGGGNMGDVWGEEEMVRREAFSMLQNKRIISFPQTIFYSDTENGKKEAEKSIAFYDGKPGITLTARERRSFEIMRSLYPNTDVQLIPDIVLSSNAVEFGVVPEEREGVLMCLRNDAEKAIGNEFWNELMLCIEEYGEKCRITDMEVEGVIFSDTRSEIVRKKMQEFRGAKLVITDRLHGMVFAALTETPCIALSNNNHKVKSTYEWIRHLPYIKYADTIDDAIKCIPELLAIDKCTFDNTPLRPYFEKLKSIIIESVM